MTADVHFGGRTPRRGGRGLAALARRSLALLVVAHLAGCAAAARGHGIATSALPPARWLEANRAHPLRLRAFLAQMPKGGDLHTHLTGAVYAESYLASAVEEKRCINPATGAIAEARVEPCSLPELAAAELVKDPHLYRQMVDALSLRNLGASGKSGHDQFFDAFAKLQGGRKGKMLAELSSRAAAQQIFYLEPMLSAGKAHTTSLVKQVSELEDLEVTYGAMLATGLRAALAGVTEIADMEAEAKRELGCSQPAPTAGCAVTRRYQLQVSRTREPLRVFAEMVVAFELAARDPLVGGMNLVAPEDNPTALRDYALHMRMLAFLRQRYPTVRVALHAGELALGLVAPEHLQAHIRMAVELAGAQRIGHGVDVMYEAQPFELLERLRRQAVLVEICLTSNDAILGVRGPQHPIAEYLKAGVPLALSSDDEGISRIDLTHEYQRAVVEHGLTYPQLKTLARNSLHYAFVAGASLWADATYQRMQAPCAAALRTADAACHAWLARNDKARLEWELEQRFTAFEALRWPP